MPSTDTLTRSPIRFERHRGPGSRGAYRVYGDGRYFGLVTKVGIDPERQWRGETRGGLFTWFETRAEAAEWLREVRRTIDQLAVA